MAWKLCDMIPYTETNFPLNVDYEGKIIDEKSSWSSYTVDTMAADELAMKVPRLSWNIFGSAAEGLSDIVKDFSDVFEYKLTCLPIFSMWSWHHKS